MPNIDTNNGTLLFWLGFFAATVFWWLVSRIRPLIPGLYKQVKHLTNVLSSRNFASVEEYVLRETVRAAQHRHLAAPLFSLDEVLVQPWLLIPPGGQDPRPAETVPSIAAKVIPYIPDWPELAAPYGVPVITPAQAILNGRNLAIVGQPGCGKSVALAQLSVQIARGEVWSDERAHTIPLTLHAIDLDMNQVQDTDPQAVLVKTLSENANVLMQPQIPRYIRWLFTTKRHRIVLILDGLDELPPLQLKAVTKFLGDFTEKYPGVQVVVAASIEYIDGLTSIGFTTLAVAAWSYAQRRELLQKWSEIWTSKITTTAAKQLKTDPVDPVLLEYWISGENVYTNPLEWTLRLWGAFAGDLSGNNVPTILETSLKRFLPDPVQWYALEDLAYTLIQQQSCCMPFRQMEQQLSRFSPASINLPKNDIDQQSSAEDSPELPLTDAKQKKKVHTSSITSQGERIIIALRDAGVFNEHANRLVGFSNPLFLGFLASRRLTPEEQASLSENLQWSAAEVALQYAAAHSETLDWLHALVAEADPPLSRRILTAARWLRDAPANAEWRFSLMRVLVGHIQDEKIPFSIRMRMIAAFYLSRDPSTAKLFKQLLSSRSVLVRRMALLGCGASGNAQSIDDILILLADQNPEVRFTACLTLAAIPEEAAFNAVVEVLLSGDEELRQAAAEALALHEGEGHQVLKEAAQENDLLTRRAAVYGLQQVHEPWAKKLLEKIAVEDAQWIVRNAAAQALEVLNSPKSLPDPLPAPSDAAWLIAFAGRFGTGILPGQPATEILLNVLKSGSPSEQIAALYYLRDTPDKKVIGEMYRLLAGSSEEVKEQIIIALWWMSISGVNLPAPHLLEA